MRGRPQHLLGALLEEYAPPNAHADDWNVTGLNNQVFTKFGVELAQEGIKALIARGFHKPGDVENRLGYYLGQLGD